MAGQKQPINLVVAKGKKHLTNEEIEQRKKEEIVVPFIDIKPPSYLSQKLKKEFMEIASKLKSLKIMSELDEDCLARYILAKSNYVKITKKLNSIISKKETTIETLSNVAALQDKFFKQCRATANDLGLTISSRCKLIMPPTAPEPTKDNKFNKYLKK